MPGTLRVVCISEDNKLAEQLRHTLRFAFNRMTIHTESSATAIIQAPSPTLIIWDQEKGDRPLPPQFADIPTILIRKHPAEVDATQTLCEICIREDLARAPFAVLVRQLLERRRLSQALAEAEALVRDRHMHDPVTGLYNAAAFRELFGQAAKSAARYKTPLTLLLIDLDNLYEFVIERAPDSGDQIIKHVAMLLQHTVREVDLLARLDDDLFAVGLPETGLEHAHILAERIHRAIQHARTPAPTDAEPLVPTVSIGMSGTITGVRTATQLMDTAHRALDEAQAAGGNRTIVTGDGVVAHAVIAQENATSQHRTRELRAAIATQTASARDHYFAELCTFLATNDVYRTLVLPHAERVASVADALAHALGWRDSERDILRRAALLHDIGLCTFSRDFLAHATPYGPEERDLIQQHPLLGVQLLESAHFLRPELAIILHHHERFDGEGYPDRIAGTNIPAGARIVALAEAWDRMLEPQPFREALGTADAAQQLKDGAGVQFDPEFTAAFLKIVA